MRINLPTAAIQPARSLQTHTQLPESCVCRPLVRTAWAVATSRASAILCTLNLLPTIFYAGTEAMAQELLLHPTSEALRRAARQLLERVADTSGCGLGSICYSLTRPQCDFVVAVPQWW